MFSNLPNVNARSAGTSSKARKTISVKDIEWADKIVVMEDKHKQRIVGTFKRVVSYKEIIVMNIPDDYQYMDPELVDVFEASIDELVED